MRIKEIIINNNKKGVGDFFLMNECELRPLFLCKSQAYIKPSDLNS